MNSLETPVALFVFNRPDLTARVFERIAAQRPRRLLVIADGAREGRGDEAARCAAARAVTERIDWACEVDRNYAPANMGCRGRVASGLDWVFEQCEAAIILEDDCLPDPSFFRFCSELLTRYRDDERVSMISGVQLHRRLNVSSSYYFSRFAHIWGWASWRRSWRHYDVEMRAWPALRSSGWLEGIFGNTPAARRWQWLFDETYAGRIDTWDYQWVLSCWMRDALAAMPPVNLVSNLGFGPDATNTIKPDTCAELPTRAISFPLIHPPDVTRNRKADSMTSARIFGAPEGGLAEQLTWRLRQRTETLPASLRRVFGRLLHA